MAASSPWFASLVPWRSRHRVLRARSRVGAGILAGERRSVFGGDTAPSLALASLSSMTAAGLPPHAAQVIEKTQRIEAVERFMGADRIAKGAAREGSSPRARPALATRTSLTPMLMCRRRCVYLVHRGLVGATLGSEGERRTWF